MKILIGIFFLFLVIFISCKTKKEQIEGIVYKKVNFLFKNMGQLDRNAYDSIFFLRGCENDTTEIKNYLSDILKSSDTTFQMLDKENLVVEYFKIKSKSKFQLLGISNSDTVISITDKNGFKISESETPFLLQIKEGKIASFGVMRKDQYLILMSFCN